MEYTNEKHSSGVAKAGLTLGIIGTSLAGLLAANNGGLGLGNFGGLFGNNNASRAEIEQSKIAELESKIAELKSMRYTDYVGIDLYKNIVAVAKEEDAKINAVQEKLFGYVIDLDKRTALNDQAQRLNREYDTMARDYQFALMDCKVNRLSDKLDCCCERQTMVSNFNQQLNELAYASIVSYINSNFIPGMLKVPASAICPPVVTA
jgi:hypothetical protein